MKPDSLESSILSKRASHLFSLIIPTLNEKDNIESLLNQIMHVLNHFQFEIIVVDDNSSDGTWQTVESYQATHPMARLYRRMNEKGLSSAVVEGFKQAKGDILGVMDADHSHDARLLPQMIQLIGEGKADCVIASRKIEGAGIRKWPWYRRLYSLSATKLAQWLSGVKVSDPLSGFFCVARDRYEETIPHLKPRGYKILLEILSKGRFSKIVELPFIFQNRKYGESKLTVKIAFSYLYQLCHIALYRFSAVLKGQNFS